ncbi:MAG TPA: helix-turn-helix transcriptional regulator [Xanthobacteraceae bacterium]|jgi:excisionase family DNA binding protein
MNEYLTTAETARYLRLGERKLYELVAQGRIPCTKATGKWLFPKSALDRWLAAGLLVPEGLVASPAPAIVAGSHDPLLEWALRESGSGLALLAEGSERGLRRLAAGEAMVAGIHLHRIEGEDEDANLQAVAVESSLADAVLISFARREQGLVLAPGNPLKVKTIADVAKRGARMVERQAGAGAQALLLRLLRSAKLELTDLKRAKAPARTGDDLALAVREGRADCGIATRAVAATRGLEFVSLCWEKFDLVLRRRDYFEPGPQVLFKLARSPEFASRAAALGGYEVADSGTVLLNR